VFWEVFPKAASSPTFQHFHRAIEENVPVQFEQYTPCMGWFENRCQPTTEGLAVYFTNITERKHADEALRRSEEQLRRVVETAGLGFYERDLIANEVTANEQFRRMMGLPEGRPDPEIAYKSLHPGDRERILSLVARAFDPRLREIVAGEFRIVRPNGEIRWLSGLGRVIFDKAGNALKFMGVLLDISERERAKETLSQANEAMARANAELEQRIEERTKKLKELVEEMEHMSYSIVHDLRAPLRSLSSFAGLVMAENGEKLSQTSQDFLHRILASSQRMDQLLLDSLNYNRVVLKELPLGPVNAAALLRGMLQTYPQFQASSGEIHLEGNIPTLHGNEAALTQCFSHLLDNALKFVEPGKPPRVRIWAEPGAESNDGSCVRIWFEDNGIGIPQDCQEKIFGMFQQIAVGYSGTGIGLTMVRKLVERMGGSVGVESEPDKGSRVWMQLPCAKD